MFSQDIYATAQSLLSGKGDQIARMANLAALLFHGAELHWVGFYRVIDANLILGPFQGPVACTEIAFGKGVCGATWKQKKTVIVSNVHEYPGHIACSPYSNSEIVIPCFNPQGEVFAVLDIDSEHFDAFSQEDAFVLEKIAQLIH